MKENIAIWGTGRLALKFYYSHKNKYNVSCFFDNDVTKQGTYIDGKPVVQWQSSNELKIIIASTWWKDIAKQLSEEKKTLFTDYIPITFFGGGGGIKYSDIYELGREISFDKIDYSLLTDRKIAVVYGNCQTAWLEKTFSLYEDFTEEYLIVEIPKVFEYNDKQEMITYLMKDYCFWGNVDLLIYQTIKPDNRFSEELATCKILSMLNENARRVNIVNLYFAGYFPQMEVNKDRILSDIHQSGLFPFGDRYINDMLSCGMSPGLIKQKVLEDSFIPVEEIKKTVQASIDELVIREKYADIKITDYIIEHYKEEQLFYSNNHPSEKILLEYADRIMNFLGYDYREISSADVFLTCGTLKGQDIPIYPSVIKALGLKKYEKRFYPNRYMLGELLLSFEDYIDLYIESVRGV